MIQWGLRGEVEHIAVNGELRAACDDGVLEQVLPRVSAIYVQCEDCKRRELGLVARGG